MEQLHGYHCQLFKICKHRIRLFEKNDICWCLILSISTSMVLLYHCTAKKKISCLNMSTSISLLASKLHKYGTSTYLNLNKMQLNHRKKTVNSFGGYRLLIIYGCHSQIKCTNVQKEGSSCNTYLSSS